VSPEPDVGLIDVPLLNAAAPVTEIVVDAFVWSVAPLLRVSDEKT
jgi:hypothetical protein